LLAKNSKGRRPKKLRNVDSDKKASLQERAEENEIAEENERAEENGFHTDTTIPYKVGCQNSPQSSPHVDTTCTPNPHQLLSHHALKRPLPSPTSKADKEQKTRGGTGNGNV